METTLGNVEREKSRSYVHNRYHVVSSVACLITTCGKKTEAIAALRRHLDSRSSEDDDETFHVFDAMHRRGSRIVYGGRHQLGGIKSHGFGVTYDVNTGKERA